MRRGLLLDCDGVLVEIELQRHLDAFNRVWQEQGVRWQWTRAQYREALSTAGGHERLMTLAQCDEFIRVAGPLSRFGDWSQTTLAWHRRKTEILAERLRRDPVRPRPGIQELAAAAHAAGWRLAVVSAGAPETVHLITESALGPALHARTCVVTGQDVAAKKPAPDAYLLALDRLRLSPSQALAVEDSRNGLLAARAAGVSCLVFPTEVTAGDEFPGAAAVEPCLLNPTRGWLSGAARRRVATGPLSIADLETLSATCLQAGRR